MFYVAPLALIPLLGLATDGVVTKRRPVRSTLPPQSRPCCRSSSRTRASSPRAPCRTRSRSCRGGGCRTTASSSTPSAGSCSAPGSWPRRSSSSCRGRLALFLAAFVGAYFVATTFVVENGRHGIHQASLGSLWAGIRVSHPDWIDRAVGHTASVDYVWSGSRPRVLDLGERVLQPQPAPGLQPRRAVGRPAPGDRGGPPRRRQARRGRRGRPLAVRARGRLDRDPRREGRERPGDRPPALPGRRPGRDPQPREGPLPERHLVGQARHVHARRLHRRAARGHARERPGAVPHRPARDRDA